LLVWTLVLVFFFDQTACHLPKNQTLRQLSLELWETRPAPRKIQVASTSSVDENQAPATTMAAPPKGLGSAVVASHMAIDIFAWVACLCSCVKPKSTMTNVVHTQNKHGCDSKL
jgi:hypothetical protein